MKDPTRISRLTLVPRTVWLLATSGELIETIRELCRRVYSVDRQYVLRRDLSVDFETPEAKIPVAIRVVEDRDVPVIVTERPRRLPMLRANIPTCYVGTTEDGRLCYTQWLLSSDSNDEIQALFKGAVPILKPDEVLLEYSYCFREFRGLGLMASVLSQVAEKGSEQGARWVLTTVRQDNIPALKGCKRSGLEMYMTLDVRWRLFRRKVTYAPLPADTLYPFETD